MKRKVLCIFSLLGYLLLFCTIFASMAEREMTILADTKQVETTTTRNIRLPSYCSQWGDMEGIFHIVEGTGWNVGNRVAAIEKQYYRVERDVILHPGEPYIVLMSASRKPQVGQLVEAIHAADSMGEKLILYFPEGMSQTKPLQNNFTVLGQGEKGMLLDCIRIKMPFFEHRMMMALSGRFQAEGMRIYSYTEAESFLQQLPLMAIIGGLLLTGVILWGGSCLLTKKRYPSVLLWINIGAIGLTLLAALFLTKQIDLPASLMPQGNIFDLEHYLGEFSNIFTAMKSAEHQSLQSFSQKMVTTSATILFAIAAVSAVLIWLENYWCNHRDSSAKK